MSILFFQKPEKVIMVESSESVGTFEFRPLEPGYGLTVGNALRRVLLSSLEGYAVTSIKIEGISHEFSTIKGIVEDVTEIILNLKQIRFKGNIDDTASESIDISIKDKEQFTAGDLHDSLLNFEVVNKDLVICNLDKSVKLEMNITIEKGRGFVTSDENKIPDAPISTIFTDSVFTPIKNVKYYIDSFRVGQKTDYEKLVMEITTDGSITPKYALTEASKILIHHFMMFSDERISLEKKEEVVDVQVGEEDPLSVRQLLKTKLVDMDLSVRALNCLKAAEVETLADLVSYNRSDLMKFRNFGKKSLVELDELVNDKGLNFGMDLSVYKLDRE